jgi:hypothetical protein
VRRSIHFASVAFVCVATLSCAATSTRGNPRPAPEKGPHSRYDPSNAVKQFFAAQFPSNPSVADIGGYNDDQKLAGTSGNNTAYGPRARLYASPILGSFDFSDFQNTQFVALLEVEGDPGGNTLPTYKRLNIIATTKTLLYCVYLNLDPRQPVDKQWFGYVTPVSGTTCGPTDGTTKVDADSDSNNGGTPPRRDDFPPVVRFGEDAQGNPSIGVKCAKAWCELGHQHKDHADPSHMNGKREGRVKAWHDDQLLAEGTPGNLHRGVRGTIIPVPDLDQLDVAGPVGGALVATITLPSAPNAGTKYDTWGLKQGDNDVWVLYEHGEWKAQFAPSGHPHDQAKKFHVDQVPHDRKGPPVPGVARWIWSDQDEDFWVACDQGCCTITDSPAFTSP